MHSSQPWLQWAGSQLQRNIVPTAAFQVFLAPAGSYRPILKKKYRKYTLTSVPSANFSCLAVIAAEIIQISDSIGFVVLYVYDLPVGGQKCANNVLGNILKEWRQVYLGTPGVLRVISIVDIKGGAIENT